MVKVVTYQAPSFGSVNITPAQERKLTAAHIWPRNSAGEEYCQVKKGRHNGTPTYTDAEIDAMIEEAR